MDLIETILKYTAEWASNNQLFALLGTLTILQIVPIKIDPWSYLFEVIQKLLGITELREILMEHIINGNRMDILNFADSCMKDEKHTEEQFRKVIKTCDWYESYIKDHNLKNGEITCAIEVIRRIYANCRTENSFL